MSDETPVHPVPEAPKATPVVAPAAVVAPAPPVVTVAPVVPVAVEPPTVVIPAPVKPARNSVIPGAKPKYSKDSLTIDWFDTHHQ